MRLWLNPEKVAERGLTADEVVAAVRSQNVQASAGVIGGPPYANGVELQIPVNVEGRLKDPEEFGEMIVKRNANGVVTRLKDVARVQGVTTNQLVGYGIVTGLNQTGDTSSAAFTSKTIQNILQSFGLSTTSTDVRTRDVAAVIKAHNLIDIKTKPRHPESNGIVERFNGTVRAESDNDYGGNYLQAEAIIAKLVQHYNEERLHATLDYMTPATWHRGQPDEVRNERARRIAAARAHRRMTNQQRFTKAA